MTPSYVSGSRRRPPDPRRADRKQRTTVDGDPGDVYEALTTEEGLAGNWTDQLEVPEQEGAVARFGFGPGWARTRAPYFTAGAPLPR